MKTLIQSKLLITIIISAVTLVALGAFTDSARSQPATGRRLS